MNYRNYYINTFTDKYNKIENDDSLTLEDILNYYKTDKQLCRLSKSISLISAVYKILELDTDDILYSLDEDILIIESNINNLENKKIWILLWLLLQKKKIDNKIYSNKEIANFYIVL